MTYGQPVHKVRRWSPRSSQPVAREFTVAPAALDAGRPATFTFRVDGPMRTVRVRIELTRAGVAGAVKRLRLGYRRTGVRHTYVWTPAAGELPAGEYAVTLQAFDDAGHGLRRTARASGRSRLTVQVAPPPVAPAPGVFPIQGAYDFGGEDGALRRPARRPHPPRSGRHRRRGDAGRRAGRVHRLLGRGPARWRRPLRRAARRRRDRLRLHAPRQGLRHGRRRERCWRPVSSSRRSARRAPHRARTCTSRSGRRAGTRPRNRSRSTPSRSSWRGRGRASLFALGEIAQLVEHTTENRGVPGSSPGLAIARNARWLLYCVIFGGLAGVVHLA